MTTTSPETTYPHLHIRHATQERAMLAVRNLSPKYPDRYFAVVHDAPMAGFDYAVVNRTGAQKVIALKDRNALDRWLDRNEKSERFEILAYSDPS